MARTRAKEVRSDGEEQVMNAVISGRAGLALVIDGERVMCLDVDDLETLVPRSQSDLRFLLADADDLITLEETDRDQIAERLDLEHDIACALDMTLIALDPDTSMELRAEAVEALDELLVNARVIERLEFTMYAKPLPDSGDLKGALFCTEVKTAAARSFFERLEQSQTAIRAVREAWDALPDQLFGNEPSAKALFHDAAYNEGLFRLLALSYGDQAKVYVFVLETLENSTIRSLHHHREVVQQWCVPIRDWVVADASAIESQYDDREKPTETPPPPPATRRDGPRGQPLDGLRPRILSESWEVRGALAIDAANSETQFATLVRRIIAGDSEAEEEIVRYYNHGIGIIIHNMVRDRSVTEDLSQETFRIVLSKIRRGDLREPETLSLFVYSVARNAAIDYIRRARRYSIYAEIGNEDIPHPTPSQLDEALNQERAEIVRQVISELKSNRDRELLLRYYISEESKDNICADLGMTKAQFNNVIWRAVQRFKELYYMKLSKEP